VLTPSLAVKNKEVKKVVKKKSEEYSEEEDCEEEGSEEEGGEVPLLFVSPTRTIHCTYEHYSESQFYTSSFDCQLHGFV